MSWQNRTEGRRQDRRVGKERTRDDMRGQGKMVQNIRGEDRVRTGEDLTGENRRR